MILLKLFFVLSLCRLFQAVSKKSFSLTCLLWYLFVCLITPLHSGTLHGSLHETQLEVHLVAERGSVIWLLVGVISIAVSLEDFVICPEFTRLSCGNYLILISTWLKCMPCNLISDLKLYALGHFYLLCCLGLLIFLLVVH